RRPSSPSEAHSSKRDNATLPAGRAIHAMAPSLMTGIVDNCLEVTRIDTTCRCKRYGEGRSARRVWELDDRAIVAPHAGSTQLPNVGSVRNASARCPFEAEDRRCCPPSQRAIQRGGALML